MKKDFNKLLIALYIILIWGCTFVGYQFLEYSRLPYSYIDSIYGSSFFSITSLHLFHMVEGVIITIIFILKK